MSTPAPPAAAPAGPRRWTARTRTTAVVSLSVFWALMAFGQNAEQFETGTPPPIGTAWAGWGLLLMLGACTLLVWRHRFPLVVTSVAAGLPLLFPTTPLPALFALAVLLPVRRGALVWVLVGATYLASFVSV